jgi:hypothetical protein
MTAINETAPTGARNRPHAGIRLRTTHALGKLGAKVLSLLNASASHFEMPPEAWRFPPF